MGPKTRRTIQPCITGEGSSSDGGNNIDLTTLDSPTESQVNEKVDIGGSSVLVGGSNSDRSPEDRSNGSEWRSPEQGHGGDVAEGELQTEGGGSADAWTGEDTDRGGSSRSIRRKRARRDGGTGGKGGRGNAIIDWRHEPLRKDANEMEEGNFESPAKSENAEHSDRERLGAMAIDDLPSPSDDVALAAAIPATKGRSTNAKNGKRRSKSNSSGKEKLKADAASNSGRKRRGRPPKKPRECMMGSYSDNGGGWQDSNEEAEWERGGGWDVCDAFVKRRSFSARNLARMARANGCFVGSVLPPLTTAEAPLVIDSDEDDDVAAEATPQPSDGTTTSAPGTAAASSTTTCWDAEMAEGATEAAVTTDMPFIQRDSSFVSTDLGDGVVGVRSRSERRRAMPGISKVHLSWGTAYLRNECIRPVPDETRLVYPNKETTGAVRVTRADAIRLQEDMFLNDTIIDFYLRYVLSRDDSFGPGLTRSSVHVFSALVVQAITTAHVTDDHKPDAYWRKIQKWTKGADVFSKKLVFFPINSTLHWSLLVLVNPDRFDARPYHRRRDLQNRKMKAPGISDSSIPASTTRFKNAYFAKKDSTEGIPLLKKVLKDFHSTEASVGEGEELTSASPRQSLLRREQLQKQQEPQPKPGARDTCEASMVCNSQTREDGQPNAENGDGKEGDGNRLPVQSSSCLSSTVGIVETKMPLKAEAVGASRNGDDVISGGGGGLTAKVDAKASAKVDHCWSSSSGEVADWREAFEEQEGKGMLEKEEEEVAVLAEDSARAPTESTAKLRTELSTKPSVDSTTESTVKSKTEFLTQSVTEPIAKSTTESRFISSTSSCRISTGANPAIAVDGGGPRGVGRSASTMPSSVTPSSSRGNVAVGGGGGGPSFDEGVIYDEGVEDNDEERPVPCMLLLDSTKGHRSHDVFKGVRKYVEVAWNNMHGQSRGDGNARVNPKSLPGCSPPIPLQTNDCDCGVYLIHYCTLLLQKSPVVTKRFLSRNCRGGMFNKKWFDRSAIPRTRKAIRDTVETLRWECIEQSRDKTPGLGQPPGK